MANKKHLKTLIKGVEVWNKWREKNPGEEPGLKGADLRGVNLSGANLWGAVANDGNVLFAPAPEASPKPNPSGIMTR